MTEELVNSEAVALRYLASRGVPLEEFNPVYDGAENRINAEAAAIKYLTCRGVPLEGSPVLVFGKDPEITLPLINAIVDREREQLKLQQEVYPHVLH